MTRPRQTVRNRTNQGGASSTLRLRGFTFVEVMIVTVIIFVALGLLLPALSRHDDHKRIGMSKTQRLIIP